MNLFRAKKTSNDFIMGNIEKGWW